MDDTRPGPELTREAIFENSFRSVYGAAKSTMLRPYGLRYRTQGHSGEVDCAEDFLTNSRIRRDNREFELSVQGFFTDAIGVSASLVGEEPAPERTAVSLPQDFILGMSLDEAMTRRRSRRQYTGERISGLACTGSTVFSVAREESPRSITPLSTRGNPHILVARLRP